MNHKTVVPGSGPYVKADIGDMMNMMKKAAKVAASGKDTLPKRAWLTKDVRNDILTSAMGHADPEVFTLGMLRAGDLLEKAGGA